MTDLASFVIALVVVIALLVIVLPALDAIVTPLQDSIYRHTSRFCFELELQLYELRDRLTRRRNHR